MIITHKIKMDLTHKGIAPNIHMVQGDYCSRNIQLQLFSEHTPWHIPKNAIALIRYCRPDHSVGVYDTLPNGSCAYVISGNTVTIGIAPDALAIAGTVSLVVTLADAEQELTTFMLLLEVQPNLTSDPMASGDYASITGMVQTPYQAEVGQALVVAAVNEYGKPTLWETTVLPEIPEDHIPLDGSKEMTGNLKAPGVQISGNTVSDPPPCVQLLYDGAEVGSISADPDTHQLLLTQISADTAMAEVYKTPAPASEITEAKQYELLTTRDAITLSQGGTGATTAEDARKNLGAASQADMLNIANRLLKTEIMDCSVISSAASEVITVNDASNYRLEGLILYGKTTQDGIPTPETPIDLVSVGNGGSVGVNVCGNNLLPNPVKTVTDNGVTFTVNTDGSVTVNGTATALAILRIAGSYEGTKSVFTYSGGVSYVLSCSQGNVGVSLSMRSRQSGEYITLCQTGTTDTFKPTEDGYATDIFLIVSAGTTVSNATVYPQIEIGSTATTYEPYVSGGTLTAQTPNGLPGIPVSSGGNYTDANGQQWASDEVDFARGMYLQRVIKRTLTGNESVSAWGENGAVRINFTGKNGNMLCNIAKYADNYSVYLGKEYGVTGNFDYGQLCMCLNGYGTPGEYKTLFAGLYAADTPVEIIHLLAEPIETPLSAEEIAAYTALHTNKPNTTVYTDSNAGIKLDYVADTKTYIDNKFAKLAAAIVNNT